MRKRVLQQVAVVCVLRQHLGRRGPVQVLFYNKLPWLCVRNTLEKYFTRGVQAYVVYNKLPWVVSKIFHREYKIGRFRSAYSQQAI